MHLKDKIDAEAYVVFSFCRTEMASKQVGVTGYNILPLDGRGDYLLWEKQVRGKLRSMGMCLETNQCTLPTFIGGMHKSKLSTL